MAYSVNQACAVMSRPAPQHCTQLDSIAGYLDKYPDHGLVFDRKKAPEVKLELWVDANFTGERRNTTGFAVTLGGAAVAHASQRQKHVATCTAMSEYHAVGSGTAMVFGIAQMLEEWGFPQSNIPVFEDNNACISFVESAQLSDASKHIKAKYHFVRELSQDGKIRMTKVPSADMAADVLTKPLPKDPFHKLTNIIMNDTASS